MNKEAIMSTLPSSIASDEEVRTLAEVFVDRIVDMSTGAEQLILLEHLSDISETVLDLLAWQYHTDFYDNTLSRKRKEQMVREAILWHRKKGTAAAVKTMIKTVYNTGSLKEWWEYNAKPYHFKVELKGLSRGSDEQMRRLQDAINQAKNVRSHCEAIELKQDMVKRVYMGAAIKSRSVIKAAIQKPSQLHINPVKMYLGAYIMWRRPVISLVIK